MKSIGYKIIHSEGMSLLGSYVACTTPAGYWVDLMEERKIASAATHFISCTNISVIKQSTLFGVDLETSEFVL